MADSWLFSNGDAAVRIIRTGTLSLEVCGPNSERREYKFGDDMEIVEFLRTVQEDLSASGYRPKGFGAERRTREERRHRARGAERRHDYQPLQSNL